MRTDGQTDMAKLIVAVCNFANPSNKMRDVKVFRRELYENCALLGYYAASNGNCLPTFRHNLSVQTSRIKNPIGFLNLEDGNDRLSLNVG